MNLLHIFATNVTLYRKKGNLSQEKLAELAGLHRTYISSVEREKRNISIDNIQAIAEALEVEPYKLFIERDEENVF
ncbi:helix-turn-helix domain-containing protein [Clostridium aminobutyricum]|uniref:Helix-turn-helix transcriptional regulator n=1 Tax=Clostridium aminobutyricum TaxID=33953 RepID=A0A939II00_CLOAM|nr:helix-turn-helix transcriptional regulator [Clostridium aminobutyricum]MBN7774402.1 helix-turn-helix transcriptional regulator [Clostridium aminobutyricum]